MLVFYILVEPRGKDTLGGNSAVVARRTLFAQTGSLAGVTPVGDLVGASRAKSHPFTFSLFLGAFWLFDTLGDKVQ